MTRTFFIQPARSAAGIKSAARLFRLYAASLEIDLAYQNFAAELEGLPGQYAPPAGELLLAVGGEGEALGCVALRPLAEAGCCEMKRLYVLPEARGSGVGDALVQAAIAAARTRGYREMRLDTLPSMTGAQALYRRHGFESTAPYYDTPVAGTVFLRCVLHPR